MSVARPGPDVNVQLHGMTTVRIYCPDTTAAPTSERSFIVRHTSIDPRTDPLSHHRRRRCLDLCLLPFFRTLLVSIRPTSDLKRRQQTPPTDRPTDLCLSLDLCLHGETNFPRDRSSSPEISPQWPTDPSVFFPVRRGPHFLLLSNDPLRELQTVAWRRSRSADDNIGFQED